MATQSHLEKEPKQQQGEGPTEPKNEVVAAPGDSSGTSKADTGPAVPTVSSDPSLSEAPVSQSPVPLPPSSPRAQPSRRHRAPRASLGSLASQPGRNLRGRTTPPPSGPVLRSRATLRRPAVPGCPSEPGRASRLRSASASTAASARSPAASSGRASVPPRCAVRNQASGSGTGLRSRGSSRGRARRRCASLPGPARRLRRHHAPSPVPDPQRGASAPGSTRRRRTSRPRGRPGCSASVPNTASHSRASRQGPALRSQASGSSHSLRSGSSPMSSALASSSMTAGCVPRSRTTQRRSTRSSRLALPEPDGQRPPSPGLTSGSLVFQSSSSPPDPGAPSLPSEPSWHAVRMRASSPSPPGRLYPFPGWFVENPSSSTSTCPSPQSSICTSSSGFPDQGPSSPPAIVSDHSSSSTSPNLDDPVSISALSPASLRRTLLLEFDALSPASPGEQAEIQNIRDPPTPPPGEL